MTVNEIFSQISQHMVEGLMFHSQLSDFFNFLGLKGFSECHKYHYFCENKDYKDLSEYFMLHYNKIVAEGAFKNPNVIPKDWLNYTQQQVDAANKPSFIKAGLEHWISWEEQTKQLYEQMYLSLWQVGEIAAALAFMKYVTSVDEELAGARNHLLYYSSMDFDMSQIMSEQEELYKDYKKKLKELKL